MELYDELWLEAAGDVRRLIRADEAARSKLERAMSVLFLAMRRDLRSTNISQTKAEEYMHFYQCGMLDLN
jgi:hypothetical protein